MGKILGILVLVAAAAVCWAAPVDYRKVQFQRRFLAGVWRNIKHINADSSRFGSIGERVTAGTRSDNKNWDPDDNTMPDEKTLRDKIAAMQKMLQRKDLKPEDRDQALFYIGLCHLSLGDVKTAESCCRKLEQVNPKGPYAAQLRKELSQQKGQK